MSKGLCKYNHYTPVFNIPYTWRWVWFSTCPFKCNFRSPDSWFDLVFSCVWPAYYCVRSTPFDFVSIGSLFPLKFGWLAIERLRFFENYHSLSVPRAYVKISTVCMSCWCVAGWHLQPWHALGWRCRVTSRVRGDMRRDHGGLGPKSRW